MSKRFACAVLASLLAAAGASVPVLAEDAPAATPSWMPMPTYGKWHSSRIGGGGYVQNVLFCPTNPQRLYAYVDVGGAYRSDDGGNHWTMLHGALPANPGNYCVRGMLVDPRDDKKLIIAVGSQWSITEGLFVSDDAGATWRATSPKKIAFDGNGSTRGTGLILARNPANPDTILAASADSGLWRSDNNGESWKNVAPLITVTTDLKYDAKNPSRIWMCGVKGKTKSTNGLVSGVWRSTDGGATWEQLTDTGVAELVQDPKDPDRLYGLRGNLVWTSADAGKTWTQLTDGLAIDPAKAASTNGFEYRAITAASNFILLGSSNGTVYKLKPGETQWQKIERQNIEDPGLQPGKHGFGWAMGSIVVDPNDENHWIFTDFFSTCQTHDAGLNWKICVDGIEDTVIHAVVQDPTDPGVVHLGMADNGYFHSEDGGVSFKHVNFPDSAITCKDIAISPSLPSRLYAIGPKFWDTQIRQVFVSIDRGAKWERSPMIGLPDLSKAMCNSIAADPNDPYTVYLGVSGDVKPNGGGPYKSTDGGKSWTWIGHGLATGKPLFWIIEWAQGRELAAGKDGTLVAISRIEPSRGIYRFDAGEKVWHKCQVDNLIGQPCSVVADLLKPGRYFVATRDGAIYRSTDNAATWQRVYDQPATHVIVDRVVPDRVAASTKDGVVFSSDGGDTWKTLDKSLPARVYGNMPAFAGDRIVVGSDGSGAFWIPLTDAAATPVAAKPAIPAEIPPSLRKPVQMPKLANLDFRAGDSSPAGWSVWKGAGELEIARSSDIPSSVGKAGLSIKSVGGPANGTAYQDFAYTPTPFEVFAWAKASGPAIKGAQLAVQAFDSNGKQVSWIVVSDLKSASKGRWIKEVVSLPPTAATCKLLLLLDGDGEVVISPIHLSAKPSALFP